MKVAYRMYMPGHGKQPFKFLFALPNNAVTTEVTVSSYKTGMQQSIQLNHYVLDDDYFLEVLADEDDQLMFCANWQCNKTYSFNSETHMVDRTSNLMSALVRLLGRLTNKHFPEKI